MLAVSAPAERRFKAEVAALGDELRKTREHDPPGLKLRTLGGKRRKPARNLIGIDEIQHGDFTRRKAFDEGRLPRPIRACNDVE